MWVILSVIKDGEHPLHWCWSTNWYNILESSFSLPKKVENVQALVLFGIVLRDTLAYVYKNVYT